MLLINKRFALPLRNSLGLPHLKVFNKGYFYLGLALLIAFFVQEIHHWRWPWLTGLQDNDVYKQLSGFVLVAFVIHQWHCSVLRNKGLMREACRILHRHKLLGSLAPLFFYAHSQTLGFAYLQVLSWVYFTIVLSGLFNFETTHIHKSWYQPIWIIIHIGLSTVLLFLMSYHIFISYAYQ